MSFLILGIVIWSVFHFVPAVAVSFRAGLVQRLGLATYKGIFALVTIGALLLIIYGWKSASIEPVFVPPPWGVYPTVGLTLVTFILFFAPYIDNSISRLLRHPQLFGVILFGIGHLFTNGEARSVVLFGGFTLWAILEISLLNRRDGAWKKPDPASPTANIRLLLTGIGFFAMFMYLHSWLFGVGAVPLMGN